MQNCNNQLLINQNALKYNIEQLTKRLPEGGRLMAMVKGNGYGMGAVALSTAVQQYGVDILGVSHLDEAVFLRQQGITCDIFVLSAPLFELEKAVRFDVEVALSSGQQALKLNDLAKAANKVIKVHLHIDTGMRRFGCHKEKSRELYHLIDHLSHLQLEGIMSHFIGSSLPAFDLVSLEQLESFLAVIQRLPKKPPYVHIACSSSLRRLSFSHTNMARVGAALFGLDCSKEDAHSCPLMKALTLTSRLHSIQDCAFGEGIGYFHTVTMRHPKGRIGIIPFGYYDGMPTTLSDEAFVLIHNKKAPIIGKVCMDFTLLDISEIPEACVGDEVTIFSPKESPEQFAKWANMNVRALLCRLGDRVERVYINHPCLAVN